MRRFLIIVFVICLTATAASAQGKIDTPWKCAKPAPAHTLVAGDQPNHAYTLQSVKCTATKGEIAGVKQKEGVATEFLEATGNTVKGHGTFVETLANGDKIHYSFETSGTSANNMFQSGNNKWTITGGTGKFKGIKGSGTCKGKGNPDGSAEFSCTGTYTMPK
jgi:hypothetical protein